MYQALPPILVHLVACSAIHNWSTVSMSPTPRWLILLQVCIFAKSVSFPIFYLLLLVLEREVWWPPTIIVCVPMSLQFCQIFFYKRGISSLARGLTQWETCRSTTQSQKTLLLFDRLEHPSFIMSPSVSDNHKGYFIRYQESHLISLDLGFLGVIFLTCPQGYFNVSIL